MVKVMARSVKLWFTLSAAAVFVSVPVTLLALAAPSPLRVEMHRYYVQGHRQGRLDAMAGRDFHLPDTVSSLGSLQGDFFQTKYRYQGHMHQEYVHQEYVRGYQDGYQMVLR